MKLFGLVVITSRSYARLKEFEALMDAATTPTKAPPRAQAKLKQHTRVRRDRTLDFNLAKKGLRKCSLCEEVKPVDEFWRNRATIQGRDNYCALCVSKRKKARRQQIKQHTANRANRSNRSIPAFEAFLHADGQMISFFCEDCGYRHTHCKGYGIKKAHCSGTSPLRQGRYRLVPPALSL